MSAETTAIIEKWYKKLSFDAKYDAEFYDALSRIFIPATTQISTYPLEDPDGKKNLLSFLYFCEDLSAKYSEAGISEDILLDSLSDIVLWCNAWSEYKGALFLGETAWVARTLQFRIFRLGRLQFCMETAGEQLVKCGIQPGERYLSVHIPKDGPLDLEACRKSFAMAREFFPRYFPDFAYTCFSCNSWLLDETLRALLPANSNILQFAQLFRRVDARESLDIIRFVFGLGVNKENLAQVPCPTRFAQNVRDRILAGAPFYLTRGLIER